MPLEWALGARRSALSALSPYSLPATLSQKGRFTPLCQVALVVKNPPTCAGRLRDTGSIPGSGRSPGGRHGNPFQYSSLENPMGREAWQASHRVRHNWSDLACVHTRRKSHMARSDRGPSGNQLAWPQSPKQQCIRPPEVFAILLFAEIYTYFPGSVAIDFLWPHKLPGSSVHWIFHARILEQIASPFSRRSSQPRDQNCIFCICRWAILEVWQDCIEEFFFF